MVAMNIKPCRLFKWQLLTKSQFKLCFWYLICIASQARGCVDQMVCADFSNQ